MPKLDEKTTLYKECKRVADFIRGKRNWSGDDSATVAMRFVLVESQQMKLTADEALADENRDQRQDWVNELKVLYTAGKNFQNSYLEPSGLMPKVEATERTTAEFA